MKFLFLWFIGVLIYFFSVRDNEFYIEGIIVPLIFCFFTILAIRKLSDRYKTLFVYLLFFSTGILTFFGVIKPLTGSISESPNLLLFGFSFYTLSLAYLAKNNKSINFVDTLKVSNPALLATGPIALFIKNYRYRSFHYRLNYYLPFFIIGFFYSNFH